MKPWLILYLFAVNITAFALFGADKRKARRNAWRISEKALFLSAVLGRSLGAMIGMRFFHHETKHWYFVFGIPAILVLQIIGCVLITNYL